MSQLVALKLHGCLQLRISCEFVYIDVIDCQECQSSTKLNYVGKYSAKFWSKVFIFGLDRFWFDCDHSKLNTFLKFLRKMTFQSYIDS
uniref:Ovule protein n=1 Tax=Romanomermis culicivorax TaxID=13658 RepID=A0A915IB65_ROMCU